MNRYQAALGRVIGRPRRSMLGLRVLVAGLRPAVRAPADRFLPDEDQGSMFGQLHAAGGRDAPSRPSRVGQQIEHYFLTNEKDNVDAVFTVAGFSFAGNGQNSAWPSST